MRTMRTVVRPGWASVAIVVAALLPGAAATAAVPAPAARADSLWSSGWRDSSQALLERWIPRARRTRDAGLLCALLNREGAHLVAFGEVRRAEPVLREALALAEARRDSAALLPAVRWLSIAVGQQGRLDEAHGLYLRLLEVAARRGDRRHEAWALVGLGWEARQRGHNPEAIRRGTRAAELFASVGDAEGEIWALNGLGTAWSGQADFRAAARAFRRVAAVARRIDFPLAEALALNNLGDLEYGLGDPGRALETFRRSLTILRRIRQDREAVTPGINIAICLRDLGRLREADETLARCAEACSSRGYRDLQAMALFQRAGLCRLEGRARAAVALQRRALALGPAQTPHSRAECLVGLSDALAGMDSAAAALACARAAAALPGLDPELRAVVERTLAARLGESRDLRGARLHLERAQDAADRSGWSGLRADLLARRAGSESALGRRDGALALLRRAAQVWEEERGLPLDPEWREQRGATGQRVFTALAGLLLDAPGDAPPERRADAAFDAIQRFKTRTLLERMAGPGPGSGATPALASATALRRQLGGGDLFLDYCLGPERSFLFAVTRGCVRAVGLPPARELEPRIRLYRELLAGATPGTGAQRAAALAAAARELGRLLLGPVEDLLAGSRRVMVSPEGALNLLPFVELPGPDGQPRPGAQAWTRVPSAAALLRIAGARAGADDGRGATVVAWCGAGTLPGAGREVAWLRREFREVRTARDGAAGGARRLAGATVLHLAAHLEADDQHPWRSRMRLDSGDSVLVLEAAEVARQPLAARLAVLSSCSSAGGRILSGEGVLGFSGAMLGAGVPAVLGSLWPVDDGATVLFVRAFYDELARGATAALALRRAQSALRARPATRDPRDWAGFVLVGDGGVRVPLRRRWSATPFAGPALVLAGLLLGAAAARRSRSAPPALAASRAASGL